MHVVDIQEYAPDVVADLRYATDRNIADRPISQLKTAQLVPAAARALRTVSEALKEHDVQLVIWDAYRTPETQAILRKLMHDERYVLEESKHCKGLAVDVTLAHPWGRVLDMGTDHDDFSPRAHADAADLTERQQAHRAILKAAMEKAGFTQWPYEWWHFDFTSQA